MIGTATGGVAPTNNNLSGAKCEVCGAPALWVIGRLTDRDGMKGNPGVGRGHPRCGKHVTSIDAIEREEREHER